jgi:hypothetical protein
MRTESIMLHYDYWRVKDLLRLPCMLKQTVKTLFTVLSRPGFEIRWKLRSRPRTTTRQRNSSVAHEASAQDHAKRSWFLARSVRSVLPARTPCYRAPVADALPALFPLYRARARFVELAERSTRVEDVGSSAGRNLDSRNPGFWELKCLFSVVLFWPTDWLV